MKTIAYVIPVLLLVAEVAEAGKRYQPVTSPNGYQGWQKVRGPGAGDRYYNVPKADGSPSRHTIIRKPGGRQQLVKPNGEVVTIKKARKNR